MQDSTKITSCKANRTQGSGRVSVANRTQGLDQVSEANQRCLREL